MAEIISDSKKNTDRDLAALLACQAGDFDRFGDLYDAYLRKIYDFIYYKTHHKETAEDLTSQVFMKALEKINTFDPARGTFQAWLYQIARHCVIDHYRTEKAALDIEDAWDLKDDSDLVRDLDARQKLTAIREYLARLKSEQRDIIIMRIWQGLSYAEIAAVLGKSEAGCKMAFSRTMAKLRADMPLAILLSLFFV